MTNLRALLLSICATQLVNCAEIRAQSKGFLTQLNSTTWVFGNDVWNLTQGRQYATKLYHKNKDLVGEAVGHYVSYNGAQSDLNWTSAAIVDSGSEFINVRFTAKEGDFHWVIYDGLAGAYQYFVNHALPTLGEFRTLWRLDNATFPNGRTSVKDGMLPPLSEYTVSTNVQDETWQTPNGTFLTKYDWSNFVRDSDFWGVYGNDFGSWYIPAGKDFYNGDHLKQELMIHRESKTGDAVQLNMIHGTHYQASSSDTFANNKTWGPWLWLLNDGSKADAAARLAQEVEAWPYEWFKDQAYQARGSVKGKLVLSDGRPAAGAAVFLGDNHPNATSLDQGRNYYYTTYADEDGAFSISNVRTGSYGLQAWSNGGELADVSTSILHNDVLIEKSGTTSLPTITWNVTDQSNIIFRVGSFDRKTTGFKLSGPTPYEHGRIAKCPANLTYTVGTSVTSDWCFGQSALGTHSIVFSLPSSNSTSTSPSANATNAKLIVSLAGFSSGSSANVLLNDHKIGNISSLLSSQDTYRGATRAGEWHLLEFPVQGAYLNGNGSNQIEFKVTSSTLWRGWLWDAVSLVWA